MIRYLRATLPLLVLVPALLVVSACGAEDFGKVWIILPKDDVKLTSPLEVAMGVAREFIETEDGESIREGHGYQVLLINTEIPPPGVVVPSDEQRLHFVEEDKAASTEFHNPEGKYKEMWVTRSQIKLVPGNYTLTTLFVQQNGVPYDPPITDTIRITITSHREVTFLEPADGATVTSPVTVKFSTEGLIVELAGEINEGAGHHVLVIDSDLPPERRPVSEDAQHVHLHGGEEEITIELPPGKHTLSDIFTYGIEIPITPLITDTVNITVVPK